MFSLIGKLQAHHIQLHQYYIGKCDLEPFFDKSGCKICLVPLLLFPTPTLRCTAFYNKTITNKVKAVCFSPVQYCNLLGYELL